MQIILADTQQRNGCLPFTETKAVADLRIGILTIRERWQHLAGKEVFIFTTPWLRCLYPPLPSEQCIWIDAQALANPDTAGMALALQPGTALAWEGRVWAGCPAETIQHDASTVFTATYQQVTQQPVTFLSHPWQIMQWNKEWLAIDFKLITANRFSEPIPESVFCTSVNNIFIEPGAQLMNCWLNASEGPIYIGKNAYIMEGAAIRGPFAMGEGAVVKMQASIYGATTLGPYCTAGGEIKNAVMMGYSNKAHQGYLGDAVIGEWCNLGAGTTNSNVKNTAGMVKVWDYNTNQYISVANKCGVVMGDYCTVAINSSINTGSMFGTCSNIFGTGLLPTIVPSCNWGVSGIRYNFNKALDSIRNWKQFKGKTLTEDEISVLKQIFAHQ
ncbi:MAG: glucose-1-phosphate thymidylyltransferase [Sediminibacterium sp.]|nr:glucose-1-phosphate thymidylyltransferase [Sediminibacterium sp.]